VDRVIDQPFAIFRGRPVVAFVTTRAGGVSKRPFDSLNLAYLTADRREDVRTNRERLARALGLEHDELLIGRQVHGGRIHRAERIELGVTEGDGILLSKAGTAAMVVVADCLPILLYEPVVHVGAVVHAGWRGLAAGVVQNAVVAMADAGGTAESVLVGVGPGIGRCCYEVGPEVIEALKPQVDEHSAGRGDRRMLDLRAVARRQLKESGIADEHLEEMDVCTRCEHERYFSARAGEPTGRFAAGLKLLKTTV
jgi:YfiH family protein